MNALALLLLAVAPPLRHEWPALADDDAPVAIRLRAELAAPENPWRTGLLTEIQRTCRPTPRLLRAIGDAKTAARSALPLLVAILQEKGHRDRILAAKAVWRIGHRRLDGLRVSDPLELCLAALGESVDDLEALLVIGHIGPPARRLLPLVRRIDEKKLDNKMREAHRYALEMLSPPKPPSERELATGDWTEQIGAACALHERWPGHPKAVEACRVLIHHPEKRVDAFALLERMGPRARVLAPQVARMLGGPNGIEAGRALWKLDPEAARKAGAW